MSALALAAEQTVRGTKRARSEDVEQEYHLQLQRFEKIASSWTEGKEEPHSVLVEFSSSARILHKPRALTVSLTPCFLLLMCFTLCGLIVY